MVFVRERPMPHPLPGDQERNETEVDVCDTVRGEVEPTTCIRTCGGDGPGIEFQKVQESRGSGVASGRVRCVGQKGSSTTV